ncbi:MAG TPA: F0F1 ATP synthase subunit A [Candidatus Paceibacterota bacterium]|nr:F0F1 ATP synthase subunit A [Candidatus Pacearchaeota archaeon]HRZ51066.1 F0F1 ATP synthase subunit A [Candidatus Paceibacterota bacterium]HSA36775.1 F0F1 ATP synthase subunit A [Candidatus Paceibacterota bacterium]
MEEIAVAAMKISQIGGLVITNTFFWTLTITAMLIASMVFIFREPRLVPTRTQNFFEFIIESLMGFTDSITGSREKTQEIFPLAATLFLLIWSVNLIELVPGVGVFPMLRSPSSDLNFTIALAVISIVSVNYYSIKHLGIGKYLGKFFNFKNPIQFFVGILEFVGEFSKVISLSMRLFGNLFAGEVLLIIISSLCAYLLPLPFLALEVLVTFIQALVFATLTVVFYSIATIEMEHG